MLSRSSSSCFHSVLSDALGHLILGFRGLVAVFAEVYPNQSPALCQSCSESVEALEGGLHPPPDPGRHSVLSPEWRVPQYCGLNPGLEYSCISLAKLAMRCPLDLTRWQPDFPCGWQDCICSCTPFRSYRWTDPSLFVVDWGRAVSIP